MIQHDRLWSFCMCCCGLLAVEHIEILTGGDLVDRLVRYVKDTVRKADLILLLLCLVATAFGCLAIASATNAEGTFRYVIVQIGAAFIGVFLFFIVLPYFNLKSVINKLACIISYSICTKNYNTYE